MTMHPAPVSGSPVPVGKAYSLPSHPGEESAVQQMPPPSPPPSSRCSLRAKHAEARRPQQPPGGFVSGHEARGERGGACRSAAAEVDAEDEKDRRADDKDLATTEVSAAASTAAVRKEEGEAARGEDAEAGLPGAAICPADGGSLPACNTADADDGGVGLLDTLLEKAEGALARLYDMRDNFFSADKDEKKRCLKGLAQEVFDALGSVGARGMPGRARVSYIRGRALDAFGVFDPEAEKCLASAVKLRPAEADGWSGLGHCYWKKPDLFAARRCFLTSLEKSPSADTMRQLSMLLRQLPGTAEETREDHLQESLRLAKGALTMDIGCGDSWYVLGNALVASFFMSSGGFRDLDRALQAYKKAESNGNGGNPDLFFNRAHVFHYREDYPEAIRDYRLAQQLDPLLPVVPALQSIETGVERLSRLVERKGGLKAKRLSQLIAPLWGGSAARGLDSSYRLVGLKELRLGKNKGVAVALKVVMPAGQTAQPPERFVVVDRCGETAVLSLYSISKEACEKIQSKDTLVVKDPSFRTICADASPPARTTAPPGQPTRSSRPDGPTLSGGGPDVGRGDAVRSSASGAAERGDSGVIPTIHGASEVVSPEPCTPDDDGGGGGKAAADPAVLDPAKGGGARAGGKSSGSAAAGAVPASNALPRGHDGDVGDPATSSSSSSFGGPEAAAAAAAAAGAGAGAALPTTSYPGIQADPAEVLLNGATMMASFAPPTVRLATFDK